ncbi:hypothetical protein L5220_07590 [Synechococcus sp. PCC 6716]|nr:hypothetical protein [Synechococcus sp. PCC 6716]
MNNPVRDLKILPTIVGELPPRISDVLGKSHKRILHHEFFCPFADI